MTQIADNVLKRLTFHLNGIDFIKMDKDQFEEIKNLIDTNEIGFENWTNIIKVIARLKGYKILQWDRKNLKIFSMPNLVQKVIYSEYYIEEMLIHTNAQFEREPFIINFELGEYESLDGILKQYIYHGISFYTDDDLIVYPKPLMPLLNIDLKANTEPDIIRFTQLLRNELLINNRYDSYYELLTFLKSGVENFEGTIYNSLEIQNYSFKYINSYIRFIKIKLNNMKLNNFKAYKEQIVDGQLEIWDALAKCYSNLSKLHTEIEKSEIFLFEDSYGKTTQSASNLTNMVSKLYSEISLFEKRMGIDKYLSYSIAKDEINLLNQIALQVKVIEEAKSKDLINLFKVNWNTSLIGEAICGAMNISEGNILNRYLPSEQDNMILFVIDGYGSCQYNWYNQLYSNSESYTYGIHLFNWLKGKVYFKDEYHLGTPLVSDTGAGIASIFLGKNAKKTGMIASKLIRMNSYVDVKECDQVAFDKISNPNAQSFVNKLQMNNINTDILYGSRYSGSPYSSYCYGNANVIEERIPDRIFNRMLNLITPEERKLIVGYYPKLDSTGHPTGAFTLFEHYEHDKLNFLLTNFLIDLLKIKPWIFNGKNSILITADHGMAETSQKIIRTSEFYQLIPDYISNRQKIVQNNRALFIYDVKEEVIGQAIECIRNILDSKEASYEVITRDMQIAQQILCGDENTTSSRNCPDIIVSLKGPGIFFDYELPQGSYHLGAHGGCSIEESLVPLIVIRLTEELKHDLENRFNKLF